MKKKRKKHLKHEIPHAILSTAYYDSDFDPQVTESQVKRSSYYVLVTTQWG